MTDPMYRWRCAGCGHDWQALDPPPTDEVWCAPICRELSFTPAPGDPLDGTAGTCWRLPSRHHIEGNAA